jgi:large subunit ribosomal protein L17
VVFSYLKDKVSVTELFRVVAPKVATRPGGYTRILKTGFRLGDAADMALIELVDFNEAALTEGKKVAKKTTRRSRAKKAEHSSAPVSETTPEATETVEPDEADDGTETLEATEPDDPAEATELLEATETVEPAEVTESLEATEPDETTETEK